MAGSVIQSTSLTTIDATSHIFIRLMRYGQELEFVNRYGDAGEDEFLPRTGTVSQRTLLMNGDMVNERITSGLNAPAQIALLSPDSETMIDTAFMAALSRHPTDVERERYLARMKNKSRDDRGEILQDLYWVLINSDEFAGNH